MRAGWAIVPFVFAGGILAACSLSLDGYSNGASPESEGGAVADGNVTQQPDGDSSAPDSAADVHSDAASSLCAQTNLYCTTFDDNSLSAVSTETTKSPNAVVEVIDGSAHAATPSFTGDGHLYATFVHQIPASGVRFAADADLFVKTPEWGQLQGNATVFALLIDGNTPQMVELFINNGYTSLTTTYQDSQLVFDNTSKNLPFDRWFHVRLEIDFTAGNGSYTLSFDGEAVATRTKIDFISQPSPAQLEPRIGILAANATTPPIDVRTDNLIITAQ